VSRTQNAPGEITISPINKFPDKLYRDVKASAAQKKISTKEFLIQALRYALSHDDVVKGEPVVDLENEDGQESVRRSPTADAPKIPAKNVHDKNREKGRTKP